MSKEFSGIVLSNNLSQGFKMIDWRSELPMTAYVGSGGIIQETDYIKLNSGEIINFPKPNMVSILLNSAKINHEQALTLHSSIETQNNLELEEKTRLIYDYFSKKSDSIINAYQCIECFTNISIPDDYLYRKKGGKFVEEYTKEQIERFLPTSEKLNKILPEIYEIKRLSEIATWEKFQNLEDLRNRLIHIKSHNTKKLVKTLIDDASVDYAEIAKEVVSYFVDAVLEKDTNDIMKLDIATIRRWPQYRENLVIFGKKFDIEKLPGDEKIIDKLCV